MTISTRLLRAFALSLLLVPVLPLGAQVAAPLPAATTASLPAPRYAQPDDPWIYRGTDIPIDQEWLFGEMPNGVRYAVRRNGAPPGQVALRVRIDAGSLHENDSELGFAHLIEHLTFRESKYFGISEAIPHFQRLGASLGHDTNAITSPTQTVYKLDLPNATPATLEESIRLFSGMIREPVLNATTLPPKFQSYSPKGASATASSAAPPKPPARSFSRASGWPTTARSGRSKPCERRRPRRSRPSTAAGTARKMPSWSPWAMPIPRAWRP